MQLLIPKTNATFCALRRGPAQGLAIIDLRNARPSIDAAFEHAISQDIRSHSRDRSYLDLVRIEAKPK
jgi:hypothetical protein